MTDVLVLGAGVIGVTTAWYLRQAGFDVTVVERKPSVAMETSFANGGQLSVSHAEPWANPSAPSQILKWLTQAHSPLRFKPTWSARQYRWAWQFLKECSAGATKRNIQQLVGLGLYSRAAMQALCDSHQLEFHWLHKGILHLYTDAATFERAKISAALMRKFGCERQVLSAKEAKVREPALLGVELVGATYTEHDASGNAFEFTQNLAKLCEAHGVRFMFNTTVVQLCTKASTKTLIKTGAKGDQVVGVQVITQDGTCAELRANRTVLCLGAYSPQLAKTVGVDLLICPAKGYSATFDVVDSAKAPMVSLTDDEHKLVFSRYQDSAVDQLRVAGMAELSGYDTSLDTKRAELITRRVVSLFPNALNEHSVRYWSGLRPSTPSNVPYIGKVSMPFGKVGAHPYQQSGLWLNTGHGTLGFTHACGSAKALSLLMQGKTPELDFDFMS